MVRQDGLEAKTGGQCARPGTAGADSRSPLGQPNL